MRHGTLRHWLTDCLMPCLLGAALAGTGCGQKEQAASPVHVTPRVHVQQPVRRTIERSVGQPAFIEAYEQTSIYPKIAGYIESWKVDIGDRVKENEVLAELFVPELDAQFEQKKAQAEQDEVSITASQKMVAVAEQTRAMADAAVDQAKADLGSYEAAVERWESEVQRLAGLVDEKVVDRQILDESQKQLKSNVSQREGAKAGIAASRAKVLARRADVDKAKVDVDVARAKAKVSQADRQRYAELVSYTKLTAPYDGVVVARNANTGDFVQSAGGDQSASRGSADQSPGRSAPVYVVARTDRVRVFIDVPEIDAEHIHVGSQARIRVQALDDAEFVDKVTRTSWSLNVRTRTLRAEVDLPNPESTLLPGMYAYGYLEVKRSDVLAVPDEAIVELGNKECCFLLEDGKSIKTPIMAGASDGTWTEIVKKYVHGRWEPFTGTEQVIIGDLSHLVDEGKVDVVHEHDARK
jgi:HlyD family secretion protein